MGIEDFRNTDSLDIPAILYFCKNHPESPFRAKEVNEKEIKKWIKNGSLVGRRRGKYYVDVKDLLSFFVMEQEGKE